VSLTTGGWWVFGVAFGVAALLSAGALAVLARLPPPLVPRKWATPMLHGRTLEGRLLDYVRRRNARRDDFDEVEAAVALGASTDEIVEALHALQRKGLVRTR